MDSNSTQISHLYVLTEYLRDPYAGNGYIPTPNALVAYSCTRTDLMTVDYAAAKTIIALYQRNAERLRTNASKPRVNVKRKKRRRTTGISHSRRLTKLTEPRYDDIEANHSESEIDTDEIADIEAVLQKNSTKMMRSRYSMVEQADSQSTSSSSDSLHHQLTHLIKQYMVRYHEPPSDAQDLITFSNGTLTYKEAQRCMLAFDKNCNLRGQHHPIDMVGTNHVQQATKAAQPKAITISFRQFGIKCHKTTKIDCFVFTIWFLLMLVTLFGVGYGLIHIGYGIHTFQHNESITHEICTVANYTRHACLQLETETMSNDTSALYYYQYTVYAFSKCGDNSTLSLRHSEQSITTECDDDAYLKRQQEIRCFVGDCHHGEYSLVGYPDYILLGKQDIELGCIVMIVTTIPFITFVSWVYFCYRCGPK